MTSRVEAPRAARAERAVAHVDLGAIEQNARGLRSKLGRAELCAVVKASGYGHGAVESAGAALAGGATWLAVAAGAEAAELREAGLDARLLVMGALTGQEARMAAMAGAEVVAWDERFLSELRDAATEVRRPVRVHVKLDTGMGRLGTKDVGAALSLCARIDADERLELAGVMTHFATADDPDDDHFAAQLEAFGRFVTEAKRGRPDLVTHAANSAAVQREPRSHFDMARCGIALYGLDPFHEDPDARGLEPALELRSYVAAVKPFAPGESAGYGRRWRAAEHTRVGVLPIGYGDGVRRSLSNNGEVLIGGRRRPIVGTISMDNLTVDLGPDGDVDVGEPAVLVGRQGGERISAEEVARRIGTINYEVTTGLTGRVARRYRRE